MQVQESRIHKRTTSLISPAVKPGAESDTIHFSARRLWEKILDRCHSLGVYTMAIISISIPAKPWQQRNTNPQTFNINLGHPAPVLGLTGGF